MTSTQLVVVVALSNLVEFLYPSLRISEKKEGMKRTSVLRVNLRADDFQLNAYSLLNQGPLQPLRLLVETWHLFFQCLKK